MSLQTLLENSLAYEGKKQGLSEQRLLQQLDNLRDKIAFFRQYPDLFIDFIQGQNGNFKFLYYQRIFLRIVMRHRYVYATFPRAYSKSFLSMMALMIRCVLYPGADLFVTTGGKIILPYDIEIYYMIIAELSGEAEMLIRTEGQ